MNEFDRGIAALASLGEGVLSVCTMLAKWVESMANDAERDHHRGELLAAYRRRLSWKKADVPHLRSLGVNAIAQRRMSLLTGRGRPVVRPHQPLWSTLARRFADIEPLCNPAASPQQRKRARRRWPWWRHYVEALYRGEFAQAKNRGIAGPSRYAEEIVSDAMNISGATVHKICGEIRQLRQEWEGAANFPPMTLDEFNRCMKSGIQQRSGSTWDMQ
jgi:hypothetical protein